MKRSIQILTMLVITLSVIFVCAGCGSYFSEVCGKALTITTQLQSTLADAQRARADLEKSGLRDKLPPAQQKLYDKAVAMADEGYRAAVETLAAVTDVCNPPDARKGINLIIQAWDILVPFLALIGGEGTPPVQPPTLWSHARMGGAPS